jgi:hypothetical protein
MGWREIRVRKLWSLEFHVQLLVVKVQILTRKISGIRHGSNFQALYLLHSIKEEALVILVLGGIRWQLKD